MKAATDRQRCCPLRDASDRWLGMPGSRSQWGITGIPFPQRCHWLDLFITPAPATTTYTPPPPIPMTPPDVLPPAPPCLQSSRDLWRPLLAKLQRLSCAKMRSSKARGPQLQDSLLPVTSSTFGKIGQNPDLHPTPTHTYTPPPPPPPPPHTHLHPPQHTPPPPHTHTYTPPPSVMAFI